MLGNNVRRVPLAANNTGNPRPSYCIETKFAVLLIGCVIILSAGITLQRWSFNAGEISVCKYCHVHTAGHCVHRDTHVCTVIDLASGACPEGFIVCNGENEMLLASHSVRMMREAQWRKKKKRVNAKAKKNQEAQRMKVPGWAPSANELVRLWLHVGAAKPTGVQQAHQFEAISRIKREKGTRQAASLSGLGSLASFDTLWNKHGVVQSAWHDIGWAKACRPFVNAFLALSSQPGAMPVVSDLTNIHSLEKKLELLLLSAIASIVLQRPLQLVVDNSFNDTYLTQSLFEWRVDKTELGPAAYASLRRNKWKNLATINVPSIDDVLGLIGSRDLSQPIFINGKITEEWACDKFPNAKAGETHVGVLKLLGPLAREMNRYDWDSAVVPLTRSLATTCILQSTIRPSSFLRKVIDQKLEQAADIEGAGLILGIDISSPVQGTRKASSSLEENSSDDVEVVESLSRRHNLAGQDKALDEFIRIKQRTVCAWNLTESYRDAMKSQGDKHTVAWVVGGNIRNNQEKFKILEETIRLHAKGKNGQPPVLLHAGWSHENEDTHGVENRVLLTWLEFFLLTEAHACTYSSESCSLPRLACSIGLRRQLVNGVLLEAPTSTKSPKCKRWSRQFLLPV
eukprot:m.52245 g.52245  ORF g.52245 m.52245 type:complete len:627 (+) comp10774_c0_seq1:137-2017(+)